MQFFFWGRLLHRGILSSRFASNASANAAVFLDAEPFAEDAISV